MKGITFGRFGDCENFEQLSRALFASVRLEEIVEKAKIGFGICLCTDQLKPKNLNRDLILIYFQ